MALSAIQPALKIGSHSSCSIYALVSDGSVRLGAKGLPYLQDMDTFGRTFSPLTLAGRGLR